MRKNESKREDIVRKLDQVSASLDAAMINAPRRRLRLEELDDEE
jgi:hypothetical protein